MGLEVEDYLLRLGAAFLLGAIVGIERQRQPHPGGLRTHTMVAVGAALFMLVSIHGFGDVEGAPGVSLDPSRVAAQVVTGIGFIGAGAIIAQGSRVVGLTTAASLWVAGGIGLASGAGLFVPAVATTVIVLIILVPLKYLEERFLSTPTSDDIDPNGDTEQQLPGFRPQS